MKRFLIILIAIASATITFSQPNCELLKSDAICYQACKTAMKAIRYKQGSFESQELFDKSIEQCPSIAYAYQQKSIPYLKRGQFVAWKQLIDKAVDISPTEYLGYRGWCRLQFLRDYKGAIADIEQLKELTNYDIGYCQTADYHLEIALALCYKEIGELNTAKELFENKMNSKNYSPDLYNDYHYGVIEFEMTNYKNAIEVFNQQIKNNEIAESYFYLALTYKKLKQIKAYQHNLNKAEELYRLGRSMYDNYTEAIDKIYLEDILDEKKRGS